jgi:hypothetical protein
MRARVFGYDVLFRGEGQQRHRCELLIVGEDQPPYFVYTFSGRDGNPPERTLPQGPLEDLGYAGYVKAAIRDQLRRVGYACTESPPIWRFYALGHVQPVLARRRVVTE